MSKKETTHNVVKLRTPSDSKTIQIRAPRFDKIAQSIGFTVKIKDQNLKVLNISETGVAVEANTEDLFQSGDRLDILIQITDGKEIYNGSAVVVWVNKQDISFTAALEFRSQFLSRDLIRGLDVGEAIISKVQAQQMEFMNIPENFRSLVYEIKSFLKVLKEEVDSVEERMKIESPESNQSLVKAIDLKIGPKILEHLLSFSHRLGDFLDLLKDPVKQKILTEFFHNELNEFYLTSPYASRAALKPLGYAGDYEMMNQLYRNNYEGQSLFGKIIHHYTVNETAGKSVRLRKKKLMSEIAEIAKIPNAVICSIACGPAQEVVEFLENPDSIIGSNVTIVLIDQDIEALVYAKRNISQVLLKRHIDIEIIYTQASVKDILEQSSRAEVLKKFKFDLVYSAGLFDYLSNSVAKLMILEILNSLSLKGKLLVGNFHPNNPTRSICEFSIDWKLVHRTESDMLSLSPNNSKILSRASLDDLGIVTYLEVLMNAA